MTATVEARTGPVARPRWSDRVTPRALHLATLVVAALVLVYVGRRQWFYFDEWTFLIPDGPSLLTPHGGHLTIWADLYMHGVRAIFGVHTYWPYLATVYVTHLLLAHLLWRVMLRSRVDPWIATAFTLLFMLLGPGAENIFWGFQFCYIGPMCCGVAVMLLVTRESLGVVGCVGVALLTALALGLSGTSLPMIAAAIVVSLRFRGLLVTVVVNAVPVVLYGIWYVLKPTIAMIATPKTLSEVLTFLPRYAGAMFTGGFNQVVPVAGAGAVVVVCLVVWVGARFARLGERDVIMPAALLAAGIVFAALTAYSRYGIGIKAAASGRYVYFVLAACLPALGAGATAVAGRRGGARGWVVLLVLAATVYDFGVLVKQAHAQALIEQGSRRQIYAALAYELAHPGQAFPKVAVDSLWAHALTPPRLLAMHQRGWIDVGHYRQTNELDAVLDIATALQPLPAGSPCADATPNLGPSTLGANLVVNVAHSGLLVLRVLGTGGERSRTRTFFVQPGTRYEIINHTYRRLAVDSAPQGTTGCGRA